MGFSRWDDVASALTQTEQRQVHFLRKASITSVAAKF